MTDPRTCMLSNQRLLEAKELLLLYRKGQEPAGTSADDIKYAMKLYSSAFHPDSGELQNFAGRMSFQVQISIQYISFLLFGRISLLYIKCIYIFFFFFLVTWWYDYNRCHVSILSYGTTNSFLAICQSIV